MPAFVTFSKLNNIEMKLTLAVEHGDIQIWILVNVILWYSYTYYIYVNTGKVVLWNQTDWLFRSDKDERHSTGRKLVRTE